MRGRFLCPIVVVLVALAVFFATPLSAASAYAVPAFQAQWQQGEALTPNFWGPLAIAHTGQNEPYKEAPGGQRLVQYFDKGRMELTNPSTGVVTNGLLATDLIKGQVQVGDAAFQPKASPAVAVAGDLDNPGPTYAGLSSKGASLFTPATAKPGTFATLIAAADGTVTDGGGFAGIAMSPGIAGFDATTKHNVLGVFSDYRDRVGLLSIGLALGEPFRANVKVAGTAVTVLAQVFERRVLTYTATNPDPFKVEMGNIGLAYYLWLHGAGTSPVAAAPPVPPPAPSPTTASAPPPGTSDLAVAFTSVTSPIGAGNVATATVQTAPGASCTITVAYKSGRSTAKGLDPKIADANGRVRWSWLVGGNTTPGSWPIDVACTLGGQGATQRMNFTVT